MVAGAVVAGPLVVKDGGSRQRGSRNVDWEPPWRVYHRVAPRPLRRREHLRRPLVLAVFGGALHDVGHYRAPVRGRLLRRGLVVVVRLRSAAGAGRGSALLLLIKEN